MSASIFHKVCGQCMAQVPVTANECACGYSFTYHADSRTQELVHQVADERAYETYLEARLQQALEHLRAVREEDASDKWTSEQDKKVQEALQALKAARDALNAQRRKTAEIEEDAKQWRILRTSSAGKKSRAKRHGGTRTIETAVHTVSTVAPTTPTGARDTSPARPAATEPAAPRVRIPAPKAPYAPSPSARAAAPDTRGRAMPAIEGFVTEATLRAILEPATAADLPRADRKNDDRRIAATPTEDFRQLQSSLAQRLFPAAVEPAQYCPHCTATVPADAAHCGCGYELKSGDAMPALTWPMEEPSPTANKGKRPRR